MPLLGRIFCVDIAWTQLEKLYPTISISKFDVSGPKVSPRWGTCCRSIPSVSVLLYKLTLYESFRCQAVVQETSIAPVPGTGDGLET